LKISLKKLNLSKKDTRSCISIILEYQQTTNRQISINDK